MKRFISPLLVLVLLFSSTAVQAQAPTINDSADLAAFLDSRIQTSLKQADIPGVVVVIVKDGLVLFNEGYGYADLASEIPVDPDTTGFRVASLTKLLTATAVMQLVEEGAVDLHADVNHYVPFELPNTYPEPITLHHLLTHSSGLDDKQTGDAALSAKNVIPLGDYLAQNLPSRIHPPGQLIDYSNHGYALAGYVVEAVSGRSFTEYVEEEILRPLNMSQTSLRQPVPAHIQLATGYSYIEDGALRPEPLDFSNVAPADALISTGSDMAQFMLAHLETDNSPLLTADSLQQMQQIQFTHHPQLHGRTYGFQEWETNGRPLLTHTGGQLGFSSLMTLYPEENLGIFVAQNGRFGNLRFDITNKLMNRYYPDILVKPSLNEADPTGLTAFAGYYRSTENYFPSTYEKIATIFGAVDEVEIIDNGDGTLTIWEDQRLLPLENGLFWLNSSSARIYFQKDQSGQVTHLFVESMAYERIRWFETAAFHRSLMQATILVLCSAVIVLPAAALWRRWQAHRQKRPFQPNRAYQLAFLVSLLAITFFAVLDVTASTVGEQIDYGVPIFFMALLTLPVISSLLTLPLSWLTVQMWRRHHGMLVGRVYLTCLMAATILYALILNYWNLIGYRF